MSVHLGLRHDRLLREQAAQMFEKGRGYRLTASRLGVSAATVREWQKMYRVIELPPVSWTTKIKSKKQEAFHV